MMPFRRRGSCPCLSRSGPSWAWTSPPELLNILPAALTERESAEQADTGEVADERQGFLADDEHWLGGQAIELERIVSPSGNVKVGPQQFWVGPAHAGRRLGFWMDTTTVHLSLDGVHLKSLPSRQTTVSLTRLRSAGARPAGPPPSRAIALSRSSRSHDGAASSVAVEVDRVVNASGLVGVAGRYV